MASFFTFAQFFPGLSTSSGQQTAQKGGAKRDELPTVGAQGRIADAPRVPPPPPPPKVQRPRPGSNPQNFASRIPSLPLESLPAVVGPSDEVIFVSGTASNLSAGRRMTLAEARELVLQLQRNAVERRPVGRPARPVQFAIFSADRSARLDVNGNLVTGGGVTARSDFFGRAKTAEDFFGSRGRLERETAGVVKGLTRQGFLEAPPNSPQEGGAQGAAIGSGAAGGTFGPVGAAIGFTVGAIVGALRSDDRQVRFPVEVIEAQQKLTSGLPLTTREQFLLRNVRETGLVLDPDTLLLVHDPAIEGLPTLGQRPAYKRGGPSNPAPPQGFLPAAFGRRQGAVIEQGKQLIRARELAALQTRAAESRFGVKRRRVG